MRFAAALLLISSTAIAAPAAITKAAVRGLGSDVVDPARGVWRVDAKRATHVCDPAALALLVAELQTTIGWVPPESCANGSTTASCTLGTEDSLRHTELAFDRGEQRVTLRALIDLRGGKPKTFDRSATCPNPKPVPVQTFTDSKLKWDTLDASTTPTIMTVAMLGKFARDEWSLARFADRERGLTIVEEPPNASDTPDPGRHLRACGAAIEPELKKLQREIASMMARHLKDDTDVMVTCGNSARGANCTLSAVGEWGWVRHLMFRQTPTGLVLTSTSVFDEHGVVDRALFADDLTFTAAATKAWLTPCQ